MAGQKASVTLRIAWILLLLMAVLMTLGGAASLGVAYWGQGDVISGVSLEEMAQLNPGLPNAIRGRRATAATFAITCGLLIGWIALTAFRRGEKWAWFGLLSAVGAGAVLSALRISLLGTTLGAGTPIAILVVLLVALAVSWRDFR